MWWLPELTSAAVEALKRCVQTGSTQSFSNLYVLQSYMFKTKYLKFTVYLWVHFSTFLVSPLMHTRKG